MALLNRPAQALLIGMAAAITLTAAETSEALLVHARLIEHLSRDLTKKPSVRIYYPGLGESYEEGFANARIVGTCLNADIVFIDTAAAAVPEPCQDKPLIATKYAAFRNDSRFVGALFWQKGRPNLILLRPRLGQMKITLPAEYEPYVEDKAY